MDFPLRTAFTTCISFGIFVLEWNIWNIPFLFVSRYFIFPSIFFDPLVDQKKMLFNPPVLVNFPVLLLLLTSSFILLWLGNILGMILILNLLKLVVCHRNVPWHLRRVCILLLSYKVFCLFGLFNLRFCSNLFPY